VLALLTVDSAQDLGANVFTGLQCTPNPVFIPKTYNLPRFFFLPQGTNFSFTVTPMQFHTLAFATFASLIAPFGGFFASGLKRTFKIKDFGHSIPGHGGMTDRMDCQFIMGFFAYMYFHSFIALHKVSLGSVLESAITGLTYEEQMELLRGMARHLSNQGVWGTEVRSRGRSASRAARKMTPTDTLQVLQCIDGAVLTKR
jgi:phosphatidate cytidylyltransferase